MTNKEIADIFYQLADMLEIKGDIRYKIIAYRKAADGIAHETQDLAELRRQGKLRHIPGIGEKIEAKIGELLDTGKLRLYEELKQEIPDGVLLLLSVPDVGPKTAWLIYQKLGIHSIPDLEQAARAGKLRTLPGLAAKSEERILHGIEALHRRSPRIPLGVALPVAQELVAGLAACPQARQVIAVGSLRRRQATVGDLDIMAASSQPQAVVDCFVGLPLVGEVVSHGDTKATVILKDGVQADLMVLPAERYGSLLQHFTGSKEHNVHLRELALNKGLSFSEYGYIRRDGSPVLCPAEEDVYRTIGLPWIPPELREDSGEFEAAKAGRLPRLVDLADLKGDLHCHSNWSDGAASIEEMAQAARGRGYAYIAITDHSKSLGIAHGLDEERLRERQKEIDAVNARLAPFRVLSGVEVDIKADATLDLPDAVLAQLDIVVASIHSGFRQDRQRMTQRIIAAMRNPHVDIIGHPTGILLGEREAYDVDFEALLAVAQETGTVLEVNAMPNRLDLDDVHVRRAVERGVKLAISTDAHRPDVLATIVLGLGMARRGWAEAGDVVNTWPLDRLRAQLIIRQVDK